MITIVTLFILGLCLGSFVNALVWRLHEQEHETGKKKPNKKYLSQLSIAKGRSMCPHCKSELATKDLIPVLSWLSLTGKCRSCNKYIPVQYPLVELTTALLFVASYIWWPLAFNNSQIVVFVLWLIVLVGLMALLVYDMLWMLLPNRLVYPLGVVEVVQVTFQVITSAKPLTALFSVVMAIAIGGGIFYILFQVSKGKWIGGGDVKLGWLLGLIVGTPARSLLFIFIAAILGSLVSIPLLVTKRLKRTSTIPFGPFLIIGAIITQLFGASLLHWYMHSFIDI